jgi:hypothetical protein
LRDTNYDVITAEAIFWMLFLMGRLWEADLKKDHEMLERLQGGVTFFRASEIALVMIEEQTGCDFKPRALESRKLYLDATKGGGLSYEPFARVVLRSVGCRSLTDPPRTTQPIQAGEWTPLALRVGTFYSDMPRIHYETFKNMLSLYSHRFPHDEFDDDDDDESLD